MVTNESGELSFFGAVDSYTQYIIDGSNSGGCQVLTNSSDECFNDIECYSTCYFIKYKAPL